MSNLSNNQLITEIQKRFNYNRENGTFTRKESFRHLEAGSEIGWKNTNGYKQVMINNKVYLVHRLVYLLEHGTLPAFIDHINQDRLCNTITNLRACTKSRNSANRPSKSKSGYRGVYPQPSGKWACIATHNNKSKWLGSFKSKIEAAKKYNEWALEHFQGFATLNPV